MISMILATLGRKKEVDDFFLHLENQETKDFEIIVVDQNQDDCLNEILKKYSSLYSIHHIKTKIKGLSRARNIGLKHATGDVICFPDDDCYYGKGTLKQVKNVFSKNKNTDCIIIKSCDFEGNNLLPFIKENEHDLSEAEFWKVGISFALFFSASAVKAAGNFDEKLGVGSGTLYGSGEETDFLYRVYRQKKNLRYMPNIKVHHPNKDTDITHVIVDRAYLYGCGCGRVLKKNNAPWLLKTRFLIRPLGGSILAVIGFNFMLAKKRYATFKGRLRGLQDE